MRFLQKPLDPEKLLDLIEILVARDVSERELKFLIRRAKRRFDSLTNRENKFFLLALKELSNREIAEALDLSKRTVETHRQTAYRKLGVSNVKELALAVEELYVGVGSCCNSKSILGSFSVTVGFLLMLLLGVYEPSSGCFSREPLESAKAPQGDCGQEREKGEKIAKFLACL